MKKLEAGLLSILVMFVIFISVIVIFFKNFGYQDIKSTKIEKDLNKNISSININNEDIKEILKIKNVEKDMTPEIDGLIWHNGHADIEYIDKDGNTVTKTIIWQAGYTSASRKGIFNKKTYIIKSASVFGEYDKNKNNT